MLVVGASSGIGAALARAVAAGGGQVAVSARRSDRLEELVAQMGTGYAVPGDATDPDDARGGLDLMVYVAGYGVLQPLVETDPDTWTDVFRVNVVGANLAAAAALDHLGPDGIAAFVSSRTVDDANPMFATYSATKAALDQCIRVWRHEHPDRRFVRIVMGNTAPTEFADHMRPERLGEALEAWQGLGIPGGMMDVDDVGRALAEALAVALDHPGIDSSEIRFDARPD